MARKRDLQPEFFDDKTMGRLGAHVAVVYQALWTICDDGGVCKADPATVLGMFGGSWPEYSVSTLVKALQALSECGRIRLYSVSDRLYAELPTFLRHQNINRPSKFRHPRGGARVTSLSEYLGGQYRLPDSVSGSPSNNHSPIPIPLSPSADALSEGARAPGSKKLVTEARARVAGAAS